MRGRILDFVDKKYGGEGSDDEEETAEKKRKRLELEESIKDIGYKFKISQQGKNRQNPPLSPIVIVHSQSQSTPISKGPSHPVSQDMFNDTVSVHESTLVTSARNEKIARKIDELNDELNDEVYVTHIEPTLEGDDEFPGVMEARKKRLENPLVHVGDSVWNRSNRDDVLTDEDLACQKPEEDGMPSSFLKFEERMHYLVDRALEAVAAKDNQLEVLKSQFSDVVRVSGQLIEKYEGLMTEIIQKSDASNKTAQELKEEVQRQNSKIGQLEDTIKKRDKELEEIAAQAKKSADSVSTQIGELKKEIKQLRTDVQKTHTPLAAPLPSSSTPGSTPRAQAQNPLKPQTPKAATPIPTSASTGTEALNLLPTPRPQAPNSLLRPAATTSANTAATATLGASGTRLTHQQQNLQQKNNGGRGSAWSDVVLVIADSNGNHLDPDKLHDSKKVVVEERNSWEAALNHIPMVPNREMVTDVVLATGTQNVMRNHQQLNEIISIADETGKKYQRAFPKATIHLGSIAPANEKCINYNTHLQELAKEREAPFITTEGTFDGKSGMVKPNVLNGLYYSKTGIRLFAKQIKRSLYNKGPRVVAGNHMLPQNNAQRPHWQTHQQSLGVWPQATCHQQQSMPPTMMQPNIMAVPHPQLLSQPNTDTFGSKSQAQPRTTLEQQLGPNMAQALETFFKIAKVCLPQ